MSADITLVKGYFFYFEYVEGEYFLPIAPLWKLWDASGEKWAGSREIGERVMGEFVKTLKWEDIQPYLLEVKSPQINLEKLYKDRDFQLQYSFRDPFAPEPPPAPILISITHEQESKIREAIASMQSYDSSLITIEDFVGRAVRYTCKIVLADNPREAKDDWKHE